MIDELLPAAVAVAERRRHDPEETLLGEEEQIVARAVEKRRREFITGRACARAALESLGLPPVPILNGERGEPLWPAGVVGSITHCAGYWAAAVARDTALRSVGIDAEPHQALPQGLIGDVASAEEQSHLAELSRTEPSVHWDRLLFSAKESVYKAWFPLTKRWLGFEDARVTFDLATGSFSARLLVPGPTLGERSIGGFEGRWAVSDGLLATAIATP